MSASESLQPALFHGTDKWLQPGNIINPTQHPAGGKPHAWATTDIDIAASYSAEKNLKNEQPALFSPILEVEPMSSDLKTYKDMPSKGDPLGFRVKKIAAYSDYNGKVMK